MMPFPDVVRIEPAGICNFKCIHCPVGREGGKRRILRYENFVRFFNALPHVPRVLVLYHGGESLLNKHLENMIAYAKGKGVSKIVFNTNASLLTAKRDLSGVDELRVSFDGDNPTENDRIRDGSHFAEHAQQVRLLALSPNRPRTIKIYNARAGTRRPADYLLDYFEGCNVVFEGVQIREWARVDGEPGPSNGVTYCNDMFETFTILSDGTVPMCCEDLMGDDIQGNVFESTPLEIWERMESVRAAFSRQEYPRLCQTCWVVNNPGKR
jgi:sulfatase maturation enzyme AslB (radical SAM superfamily)